jgi:hypothetical protein
MRNFRSRGAVLGPAALVAVLAAPVARAETSESYDVSIEQVSTNCEHPLRYPKQSSLKVIEVRGEEIRVDIEHTPLMVGTRSAKNGKLSAKSPKPGHTLIDGMDGVFSIAGRITTEEKMVSLVMVAEYQAGGKPLCTQSWNLSGLKAKAKK